MINLDQIDSPLLPEDSSSISGGVVQNVEPRLLKPDQVAYLLNMRSTVEGLREKRLGVSSIGCPISGVPTGLFSFDNQLTAQHYAIVGGDNKLFYTSGNQSWLRCGCSVSLCDTHYMGIQGRATNLAALFLATAVPMTDNASLPYGELIVLDRTMTATNYGGVRPRAINWFQSRLWALNSCQTNHGVDILTWSKVLQGGDFSHGNNLQIETDTGDQGMAIEPLRDSTPRVLLFKERSIHLLDIYWETDGYYTTSADAMDYTKAMVRPITRETGLAATRGIVWTPGLQQADYLYLSREGIRSLNRSLTDSQGGAGLPLSWRIQPYIDRINWRTAERAKAAYWDGVAYFAVPIDGSTEPNAVIAYDSYRDNFFFLDWKVCEWAQCSFQNQRKFYFLSSTPCSDSLASGYSLGYHTYETGTGYVDPGPAPICYEEHTRAFAFDLEGPGSGIRFRKRWRWLELAAQAGSSAVTLGVYYKVDDDDAWWLHDYISLDPADAYPLLPVQLPFSFSSSRLQRRKLSLHGVRPGYKIQFRFLENSYAALKIQQVNVVATPFGVTFD